MPSGYYKPVSDILKKLGYRYIQNAKGSHEKWQSERSGKSCSSHAISKAGTRQTPFSRPPGTKESCKAYRFSTPVVT
jgi:hypothetical protein